MIKLKSLIFESVAYIGNCVDILDTGNYFSDATDMAYAVENSTEISKFNFLKVIRFNHIPPEIQAIITSEQNSIVYSKYNNLYIIYDSNSDIHYFFI